MEIEKVLSGSETRRGAMVEGYIIKSVKKNSGGAQASYNIPHDFFEELKKLEALVEIKEIKGRNGLNNDIYTLNDEFTLILDKSIIKYVGEVEKPKFLITEGNGNKPQMRPGDYKKCEDINDGYDYKWFGELYNNNLEKNIMRYTLSDIDKTLVMSVIENISLDKANIVSEESLDENVVAKKIDKPHQRIFFGAPGTGKSYKLNKEAKEDFGDKISRVTFHPSYMYGNFIGAFKPFPKVVKDKDGHEQETIVYEYVPGVLMQQLVNAFKDPENNYLLIIEEINRANVAAVFGDFFQLLDRDSTGKSEYTIATSRELQEYLKVALNGVLNDFSEIYLPSNFYIWSTMNSADQGVMPMDTAFRRRWEFEYIGIDEAVENNKEFGNYTINIDGEGNEISWNVFRKEINKRLSTLNIPEDKLIGPYFIPKHILGGNKEKLTKVVKNKVLMYLYEDVARPFRKSLFAEGKYYTYSTLCNEFVKDALNIFKTPIDSDLIIDKSKLADTK